MSFRCDHCDEAQPAETRPSRRAVITRPHNHRSRQNANRDGSDDPGGRGTQIVREVNLCAKCDSPQV